MEIKCKSNKYTHFFLVNQVSINLQDSVTYKLTNVKCESHNKSWVTINECRLKAINRYKTVFNFNATFHHPTNDILMDYQFLKRENGYKPWLYRKKINGCRFLKRPYDALSILIYRTYKDVSNINHTCPLYVSNQVF